MAVAPGEGGSLQSNRLLFIGQPLVFMELLQLGLFPTVHQNGLSSFDTTGLPLFPNSTWIWFLLQERHNLLNSAIQCTDPQLM